MSTVNSEAVFLAGSIGYLASVLMTIATNRKGSMNQAELLKIILCMLLSGYIAAIVLQLDSNKYAFLMGLGLDKGLAAMKAAAIRWVPAMAEKEHTSLIAGNPNVGTGGYDERVAS